MTYWCSACDVNWNPYQCAEGCCPECGGGTKRAPRELASPDADARFKRVMAARVQRDRSEHNHKLYEAYVAKRDDAALAEFHDELAALPTRDPEQPGEEDIAA
jgi:hypothetical protein